jgi:predicted aspartyl protease
VKTGSFKKVRTVAVAVLLIASFTVTDASAAVALDTLGQFLTSHGYGGAQLVHPDNYYRLPINTNGKAGHLIVDTGAPSALIYRECLAKFGLTETKTEEKVIGAFGSGAETLGLTHIALLAIGNCTLINVPAAVASDQQSGLYRQYGSADGFFGLREMLKYGAVLDLGHRLVYLNPGGRSSSVSPNAKAILTGGGYTAIELRYAHGHLYANGSVNGAPCTFIVDTGAFVTLLDTKMARLARIGGARTEVTAHGLGSSGGEVLAARFPSLKVGAYEIKNASAAVTNIDPRITKTDTDTSAGGLLGIEYLAKNSAIFDFNSNTLYLRERK